MAIFSLRNLTMALLVFATSVAGRCFSEEATIQETLQWINTTLRENDPNVVITQNRTLTDYVRNFSVSLSESGTLEVSFSYVSTGGSLGSAPGGNTIKNLKNYSTKDLIITSLGNAAGYHEVAPQSQARRAICLRKDDRLECLLPLPSDESLHPRLLKAFRNLVTRAKTDVKEPF